MSIRDEERENERIEALPRALRDRWQPDGMSAPPEAEPHARTRPFRFGGRIVPPEIMRSLMLYLTAGIKPGGFLTSVLCNDLAMSVLKASEENLAALPVIVAYCYQEIPSAAWGSPDRVRTWLAKKEIDAERK